MKRSIQLFLYVIAVLCFGAGGVFAPAAAHSQGIATGSISATVIDASGGAVPDADVTAQNTATNQQFVGKTNSLGYVELRSIPPGTYKVTIASKQFRTLVVGKVDVVVAQNTDLGGLKLEVGSSEKLSKLRVWPRSSKPAQLRSPQALTAT